jgi:hypothetical protein
MFHQSIPKLFSIRFHKLENWQVSMFYGSLFEYLWGGFVREIKNLSASLNCPAPMPTPPHPTPLHPTPPHPVTQNVSKVGLTLDDES